MFKNYFVLTILSLLLPFVTKATDNSIINDDTSLSLSGNSRVAVIISPRAVVYADENMLTPLGYIANGKSILVGNPRRINRNLVPLVIYGKLAFLEIKDLRYVDQADQEYNAKRGAPREHDFDVIITKTDEKLSINNSVYLTLHQYEAGADLKETFQTMDNSDVGTLSGFALQLIHRQSNSRLFWGAALDYSRIYNLNMKFEYMLLSPTFGYTFISNPVFLIEAYGSLDLAVNVNYEVETNFDEEPNGYLWGLQANARIVLFPTSKYQLAAGLGYRKYSVSGLSPLNDLSNVTFNGIRNIASVSMFAGIGIKFD